MTHSTGGHFSPIFISSTLQHHLLIFIQRFCPNIRRYRPLFRRVRFFLHQAFHSGCIVDHATQGTYGSLLQQANSTRFRCCLYCVPQACCRSSCIMPSYLRSTAKGLLALGQKSDHEDPQIDESHVVNVNNSDMAAYVTKSTMTAVIAAEEAVKQEAA